MDARTPVVDDNQDFAALALAKLTSVKVPDSRRVHAKGRFDDVQISETEVVGACAMVPKVVSGSKIREKPNGALSRRN
jgi:hypothetical protein